MSQSNNDRSILNSDLFNETGEKGPMHDIIEAYEDPFSLLRDVKRLFKNLQQTQILGDIDSGVHIDGPVHIGKGSRIHSGVVLDGPVIIGENVSVRSHSQIRNHAFIGSNCVVGHSADIKRSIVFEDAKIQDGTFVGDSIIGFGARIGSGAILANRKFNQTKIAYVDRNGAYVDSEMDFLGAILGDFVRVGANAVLSPGTVIYPHTWVGSGVVASGTYARELLITVEQKLQISEKGATPLRSGRGEYEQI